LEIFLSGGMAVCWMTRQYTRYTKITHHEYSWCVRHGAQILKHYRHTAAHDGHAVRGTQRTVLRVCGWTVSSAIKNSDVYRLSVDKTTNVTKSRGKCHCKFL